jgi:hypothetical protein
MQEARGPIRCNAVLGAPDNTARPFSLCALLVIRPALTPVQNPKPFAARAVTCCVRLQCQPDDLALAAASCMPNSTGVPFASYLSQQSQPFFTGRTAWRWPLPLVLDSNAAPLASCLFEHPLLSGLEGAPNGASSAVGPALPPKRTMQEELGPIRCNAVLGGVGSETMMYFANSLRLGPLLFRLLD